MFLTSQDLFWSVSGVSGALLELSWTPLGESWKLLGRSWSVFGRSWGLWGGFWKDVGTIFCFEPNPYYYKLLGFLVEKYKVNEDNSFTLKSTVPFLDHQSNPTVSINSLNFIKENKNKKTI